MRTIQIKDNKLQKILEDKGLIHKEIGKINEEIYKLDKERTKLGYKNDALKEKTQVIITKKTPDFKLDEFEVISRVYINDKKYPEIEIVDKVEEVKAMWREEAKNQKEKK